MLVRHEERGMAWYTFPPLDELGFLRHWVTTRAGGVSWHGFNLATHVGDDEGAVNENLRLAAGLFSGGKAIFLPVQVHGNDVHEPAHHEDARCHADAVLVAKPGLPAGVLTADCIPLILADREKKAAAVVHAGRKGVFENIIGETIKRMGSNPANIIAAIAPAIRSCCYEVGEDVFAGYGQFKKYLKDGKLDIVGAARDQLLAAGVLPENIHDSGICTSCHTDEFYSHRAERGNAGRFMTGVMLTR